MNIFSGGSTTMYPEMVNCTKVAIEKPLCAGCNTLITDRFLLKVTSWLQQFTSLYCCLLIVFTKSIFRNSAAANLWA